MCVYVIDVFIIFSFDRKILPAISRVHVFYWKKINQHYSAAIFRKCYCYKIMMESKNAIFRMRRYEFYFTLCHHLL